MARWGINTTRAQTNRYLHFIKLEQCVWVFLVRIIPLYKLGLCLDHSCELVGRHQHDMLAHPNFVDTYDIRGLEYERHHLIREVTCAIYKRAFDQATTTAFITSIIKFYMKIPLSWRWLSCGRLRKRPLEWNCAPFLLPFYFLSRALCIQ